jgi:signal peptidase
MTPNIKVYDVVFVKHVDTSTLKVNDVITFYSTNAFFGGTPITHRIVEILEVPESGTMYRVKGDANEEADEEKVLPSNVVGKVMFRIPSLGKLQFFLASKTGWLVAILIPSIAIFAYDIYKLIKLIVAKNKLDKYSADNV